MGDIKEEKTLEQITKEAPGGLTDVANSVRTQLQDTEENKTITSKSVMEMHDNPVTTIQSPDIGNVQEPAKIDVDSFMKTASEDDLNRLRALKESDILTSDMIVALDLQLPNFLDVRPKDPIYVLYWGNRKYDGEDGNRLEKLKSIGFVNACTEDIDSPLSDRMNIDNGAIVSGDLILLKINKAILWGIYKANLQKANRIHTKKNVHREALEAGKKELRSQLRSAGVSPSLYEGKLGMYIPDEKELGEL